MTMGRTLTGRLVVAAAVVALASVLVTGLAMLGLFRQGVEESGAAALGRDADTVAATLEDQRVRATGIPVGVAAVRRQLARREITLAVAGTGDRIAGGGLQPPLTTADVAAVRAAGSLSDLRRSGGASWVVEGRQAGEAVVLLAQPLADATADVAPPRRRLVLPLLLGLAGGAVAGLLLARQLTRPLAALAAAARRLTAGERDVRVPPEGPVEVADVAQALGGLAAALTASEDRQRRFLLDVSHELRTPLTAVSGYAEALADGVITGPDVVPAAETIRDEAARLRRRVEDLLALARMAADDFRIEVHETDVADLVRAAGRAWVVRADAAGVPLSVEVPDEGVLAWTDGERVRQAVDALADNALRVLPAGAPLVLAARPAEPGAAAGAAVVVEVRDGGPGLAPEDLAVAFERGRLTERYRGDRPVGSGLGLALVGELARRLGGSAEARPAPEGGVAFALVLPAAGPGAAGPVDRENPNTPRTLREPGGHPRAAR
jgi:two-component system sensor histidine kinase BaeS